MKRTGRDKKIEEKVCRGEPMLMDGRVIGVRGSAGMTAVYGVGERVKRVTYDDRGEMVLE